MRGRGFAKGGAAIAVLVLLPGCLTVMLDDALLSTSYRTVPFGAIEDIVGLGIACVESVAYLETLRVRIHSGETWDLRQCAEIPMTFIPMERSKEAPLACAFPTVVYKGKPPSWIHVGSASSVSRVGEGGDVIPGGPLTEEEARTATFAFLDMSEYSVVLSTPPLEGRAPGPGGSGVTLARDLQSAITYRCPEVTGDSSPPTFLDHVAFCALVPFAFLLDVVGFPIEIVVIALVWKPYTGPF